MNYGVIGEMQKIKGRTGLEEFQEFSFDLVNYEMPYAIQIEMQILQLDRPPKGCLDWKYKRANCSHINL